MCSRLMTYYGHLGADARPIWSETYKQEPITRASESPLCP